MNYNPVGKAIKEIDSRRSPELRKEIGNYWKQKIGNNTQVVNMEEKFALSRQLLAPTVETFFAYNLANNYNDNLLALTYQDDLFSTGSIEKMGFLRNNMFNEKMEEEQINLISKNKAKKLNNKKKLGEIFIDDKTNLADYLCQWTTGMAKIKQYDMSKDFNGKTAKEYYAPYLALFLDKILLEFYHDKCCGDSLKRFCDEVFQPAFEEVKREFGLEPLITPIPKLPGYENFVKSEETLGELHEVFENVING